MTLEQGYGQGLHYWHHHLKPWLGGQHLAATQYLHLPLNQEELVRPIRASQSQIRTPVEWYISEGWLYSERVQEYGFFFHHGGVDFALPYGHRVAAPMDGYAISSYEAHPLLDRNGRIQRKNGINLRFGLGYFVQIYNPEQNRFIQLGHLSNVADAIPFNKPILKHGVWKAVGHVLTPEEMIRPGNTNVVKVKTGDLIGFVGYSGLAHEEDYFGHDRPDVLNPKEVPTWSIPHIHMDEFQRNYKTGKKDWRRDPFDLYMTYRHYAASANILRVGKEPLFLTDQSDRPLFADS